MHNVILFALGLVLGAGSMGYLAFVLYRNKAAIERKYELLKQLSK